MADLTGSEVCLQYPARRRLHRYSCMSHVAIGISVWVDMHDNRVGSRRSVTRSVTRSVNRSVTRSFGPVQLPKNQHTVLLRMLRMLRLYRVAERVGGLKATPRERSPEGAHGEAPVQLENPTADSKNSGGSNHTPSFRRTMKTSGKVRRTNYNST